MGQLLSDNDGIVGAGEEWHGTCVREKIYGIRNSFEVGVVFVNRETCVMVWSWS